MGQGRIHQHERGGNAQCVSRQANFRAKHHASPKPRLRMPNSLDSNGMQQEATGQAQPDIPARTQSVAIGPFALRPFTLL